MPWNSSKEWTEAGESKGGAACVKHGVGRVSDNKATRPGEGRTRCWKGEDNEEWIMQGTTRVAQRLCTVE